MSHIPPSETQKGSARERQESNKVQGDTKTQLFTKAASMNVAGKVHRRNFSNDFHLASLTGSILPNKLVPTSDTGILAQSKVAASDQNNHQSTQIVQQSSTVKITPTRGEHRRAQSNTSEQLALYQKGQAGLDSMILSLEPGVEFTKLGPSFGYLEHGERQKPSLIGSASIPINNSINHGMEVHSSAKMIKSKGANFKRQKKPTDTSDGNYSSGNSLLPSNSQIMSGNSQINKSHLQTTSNGGNSDKMAKGGVSVSTGHGTNTGTSNHAPTSGGSITTASSSGDGNSLAAMVFHEAVKQPRDLANYTAFGGLHHLNAGSSNSVPVSVPTGKSTGLNTGMFSVQSGDRLVDDKQDLSPIMQKGVSIQHYLGAMQLGCASSTTTSFAQSGNLQYLKAINAMKKPRATVGGVTGTKAPTVIDTRSPPGPVSKTKSYAFTNLSNKGIGTSSKSNLGVQKVTMNNTSNIGAIAAAMVSASKTKGLQSGLVTQKKASGGVNNPSPVVGRHVRNPTSVLPGTVSNLFSTPIDALLKGGLAVHHRRVQSGDKINLRSLLNKGQAKTKESNKSNGQTKPASGGNKAASDVLKKSFKTELKASNFLLNENMLRSQTKNVRNPNPSSIFTKNYFKKVTEPQDWDQSPNQKQKPKEPAAQLIHQKLELSKVEVVPAPSSDMKWSDPSPSNPPHPKKIHHRKIASLPVSNITSKFFQELNLPIAYPVKGNTMTPDESRRNSPRARTPRNNADCTSAFNQAPKEFHFEEHEFANVPKSSLPRPPGAHEFYGEEPQDLNSHRNYTSFVIEEDLDEMPDIPEETGPHKFDQSSTGKATIPIHNIRIPEKGQSGQGSGISTPNIQHKGNLSYHGNGSSIHAATPAGPESRDSKHKTNNNIQVAIPGQKSSNSPSVSSGGYMASNPGARLPPKSDLQVKSRGGVFPYSNTRNNSTAHLQEMGSSSHLGDKDIVLDFCDLSQDEERGIDERRRDGKLHTTENSQQAGNHEVKLISPNSKIPYGWPGGSASRSPSPRDFKVPAPSAPNTGRQQSSLQMIPNSNLHLPIPTLGSERDVSDYNGSTGRKSGGRGVVTSNVKNFRVPGTPEHMLNESPKGAGSKLQSAAGHKQGEGYNSREFRRQGSEGNLVIHESRRRESRPGVLNQEHEAGSPHEIRIYSEQNSYRDNFEEPETGVAESQQDGPPRIPPPRPNAPKQSRFHKFEEVFSDKNEVPLVLQKLLLVDKIKSFYTKEKTRDIQTTLDFYKIIKLIGKGNFGKVYRAVSVLTGKEVAIKKFEKADIQNDQAKQRIFQEAGNLKRLNHHNIAKLYEVFENKASIFYVMEYATEGDLLNLIETRGPLDEDSARFIAVQIVHGLKHCHSRGVLHRDIKLDNILLSDNFVVKICDFGISKLVKKGEVMTEDSGTAVYIAPEVITGKGYSGFQSDIWSLGVTLYIVLTGRIPFKPAANQSSEVLHQLIKKGEFTFPESIPLSAEVQDLIRQMLCVNPEKRITVEQIMKHPWFNRKIIDRFTAFLKEQSDEASSDHAMRKLQELGFPEPSIHKAVNEQYLNHIYCCYQIYKRS